MFEQHNKYFLILLLLALFQTNYALSFQKKQIEFYNSNKNAFKGILYLPEGNVKTIVINLQKHPIKTLEYNNPKDSITFDFKLKNSLLENGIGWFVFSPNVTGSISESYIYQLYANAADAAIDYIKGVDSLKNVKIGITGCSELGISAALAASRNPNVNFLVSITSLFQDGPDSYEFNLRSKSNYWGGQIMEKFSGGFQAMLKDSFWFDNKRYKNSDKVYEKCLLATLDTINRAVFKMKDIQLENYSDMQAKCKTVFHNLWNIDDFEPNTKNLYRTKISATDYIDTIMAKKLYTRQTFAVMQWKPIPVFTKIKIPVLVVLGDKDDLIDFEPNKKRVQYIIENYNKQNIKLMVFKNYGHGLIYKELETKDFKAGINKNIKINYPIDYITDWIVRN